MWRDNRNPGDITFENEDGTLNRPELEAWMVACDRQARSEERLAVAHEIETHFAGQQAVAIPDVLSLILARDRSRTEEGRA